MAPSGGAISLPTLDGASIAIATDGEGAFKLPGPGDVKVLDFGLAKTDTCPSIVFLMKSIRMPSFAVPDLPWSRGTASPPA
jgi:hypothetical protein